MKNILAISLFISALSAYSSWAYDGAGSSENAFDAAKDQQTFSSDLSSEQTNLNIEQFEAGHGGGGGGHPGGGHGGNPGGGGHGGNPGGGGGHGGNPGGGGHGGNPGGGGHGGNPGGGGHGGNPGGGGHGGDHGGWHPQPGHPGYDGGHHHYDPYPSHGSHYPWPRWSYPYYPRPHYDYDWNRVRMVTCTSEDSYGDLFPVTEDAYFGGYESRMEQIEEASLNRCFAESGGDPSCHLVGCQAFY